MDIFDILYKWIFTIQKSSEISGPEGCWVSRSTFPRPNTTGNLDTSRRQWVRYPTWKYVVDCRCIYNIYIYYHVRAYWHLFGMCSSYMYVRTYLKIYIYILSHIVSAAFRDELMCIKDSCHSWGKWFCSSIHWIGFVGKIYRKPWFLPSNIGVPVNFPIIQFYDPCLFHLRMNQGKHFTLLIVAVFLDIQSKEKLPSLALFGWYTPCDKLNTA